jgi:hypothetical protein
LCHICIIYSESLLLGACTLGLLNFHIVLILLKCLFFSLLIFFVLKQCWFSFCCYSYLSYFMPRVSRYIFFHHFNFILSVFNVSFFYSWVMAFLSWQCLFKLNMLCCFFVFNSIIFLLFSYLLLTYILGFCLIYTNGLLAKLLALLFKQLVQTIPYMFCHQVMWWMQSIRILL